MLLTPTLNNSVFDPAYEGWTNNLHLIIPAFHALIIGATCAKAKDPKAVEKEYEKFAELSAQVLLNMKSAKGIPGSPFILTDKILKSSPYVRLSVVEDFIPYAMTRSVYVGTYEVWTASLEKAANKATTGKEDQVA